MGMAKLTFRQSVQVCFERAAEGTTSLRPTSPVVRSSGHHRGFLGLACNSSKIKRWHPLWHQLYELLIVCEPSPGHARPAGMMVRTNVPPNVWVWSALRDRHMWYIRDFHEALMPPQKDRPTCNSVATAKNSGERPAAKGAGPKHRELRI